MEKVWTSYIFSEELEQAYTEYMTTVLDEFNNLKAAEEEIKGVICMLRGVKKHSSQLRCKIKAKKSKKWLINNFRKLFQEGVQYTGNRKPA